MNMLASKSARALPLIAVTVPFLCVAASDQTWIKR